MKQQEENEREERIENEILVDTYDEDERVMGWYYYLYDTITFPFNAECQEEFRTSVLKKNEKVEVLQMAKEEECERDMLVIILWNAKELAVPLSQLKPLELDEKSLIAIEDWHYWVKRGYQF